MSIPNPAVLAAIAEDDARPEYLQHLYRLDQRYLPDHPQRGTFTGLFQRRQAYLARCDRAGVVPASDRLDELSHDS